MAKATVKKGNKKYVIQIPMKLSEMAFEDMVQFIGLYHTFIDTQDVKKMIDCVCCFDDNFRFLDFGDSEDLATLRNESVLIEIGGDLTVKRMFLHFERLLSDAFNDYLFDILDYYNINPDQIKNIDKFDHLSSSVKQNIKVCIHGDLTNKYIAILELSKSIGDIQDLTNDLTIKVGRETFKLLQSDVSKFFFDEFTGAEFIQINEFRRRIELEAKSKEIKGYDGFLDFKLGMNEISILLRKENEPLPLEPTELKRFIKKRTKYFRDNRISALDVLNVRFFLICSMVKSGMTMILQPSGILQSTTKVVRMSLSSKKDESNRSRSANKSLIR